MRFPIKINRSALPFCLSKYIPSKYDPRQLLKPDLNIDLFEKCISSIKINKTWKSTRKCRHTITDKFIKEILNEFEKPSVIEIGASSGSTSLELIELISDKFDRYYVTDLSFHIQYLQLNNSTYFYSNQRCVMVVTDLVIVYSDFQDSFFPFNYLTSFLFSKAPDPLQKSLNTLELLHPKLRKISKLDSRISITEYDIFKPWPYEPVELIKVANVLNKVYFTDIEISQALVNLKNALKTGGILILTDNRKKEKVSILKKSGSGKLISIKSINDGAEIKDI